jgi:hypothetical protein
MQFRRMKSAYLVVGLCLVVALLAIASLAVGQAVDLPRGPEDLLSDDERAQKPLPPGASDKDDEELAAIKQKQIGKRLEKLFEKEGKKNFEKFVAKLPAVCAPVVVPDKYVDLTLTPECQAELDPVLPAAEEVAP